MMLCSTPYENVLQSRFSGHKCTPMSFILPVRQTGGAMTTKTLKNAVILTMESDCPVISDGMIVINDDRISFIGENGKTEPEGEVIDCTGKLLMPGLVNTHAHSGSTLFRSIADDLFLMDWLENYMWKIEKFQSAEFSRIASSLCHLEFLKNGITTHADMWIYGRSTADAALESGLRSVICPTVFSRPSTESKDPLETAITFIEDFIGKENETRIYPGIGPHAIYSCTMETLRAAADFARKHNILIHTHISETKTENTDCSERLGMTPTEAMLDAGIFENKVLAAHCVHMTDNDWKIFREHDAAVSYNPVSNLKLCSGIMDLGKAFENKIIVSIGTDGPQSNNSLDLLRDLKTGSLIQKNHREDPTFFPAGNAIRMATIEGARALGLEMEIGSLKSGKKADIIALNLNEPEMIPAHPESADNLYSLIVYAASGRNVTDVWVDGEQLLKDRVPTRIDTARLYNEARTASDIMIREANFKI